MHEPSYPKSVLLCFYFDVLASERLCPMPQYRTVLSNRSPTQLQTCLHSTSLGSGRLTLGAGLDSYEHVYLFAWLSCMRVLRPDILCSPSNITVHVRADRPVNTIRAVHWRSEWARDPFTHHLMCSHPHTLCLVCPTSQRSKLFTDGTNLTWDSISMDCHWCLRSRTGRLHCLAIMEFGKASKHSGRKRRATQGHKHREGAVRCLGRKRCCCAEIIPRVDYDPFFFRLNRWIRLRGCGRRHSIPAKWLQKAYSHSSWSRALSQLR